MAAIDHALAALGGGTVMQNHPLADLFPDAAHFYLPDGTPAAILAVNSPDTTRGRDPRILFTVAFDGRPRDPKGKLKMPIFRAGWFIEFANGSPVTPSDPWLPLKNWSSRTVAGMASRRGAWRGLSTLPKFIEPLAASARAAVMQPQPEWCAAVLAKLDHTLAYEQEQKLPDALRVAAGLEAHRGESDYWDRQIAWQAEMVEHHRHTIARLTAFLAEVAAWRATHGVAPDPTLAERAHAAARAYAEAQQKAESERGEKERRAAERAKATAEEAARLERLREAAPDLLAALRPFAQLAEWDMSGTAFEGAPDDLAVICDHRSGSQITVGDFRRARAAIARAGQ